MSAVRRWSSSVLAGIVLVTATALSPTAAAAAPLDSTAPQIVSFEFTPASVDVTAIGQRVTARARITDDSSGVLFPPFAALSSDTAPQFAGEPAVRRESGTALDGVYEFAWTLPRGAAPGPWTASIYVIDAAGNEALPSEEQPGSATLTVVNSGPADVTPPEVVEFEVSPPAVDVSAADRFVTMRARIVDSGTGARAPWADLWQPDTGAYLSSGEMRRVSGSAQDGWYEWTTTVPRGTRPGAWKIGVWGLTDEQGNNGSFDGVDLEVGYAASDDVTAPRVQSLTVTPSLYDASDPFTSVTIRARVTDAGAGVVPPQMLLSPDSMGDVDPGARAQVARASAAAASAVASDDMPADARPAYWEQVQLELVSGNANDGIYEWTGWLGGALAYPGRWTVQFDALRDYAGNLTPADMPTASFTVAPPAALARLAGDDRFSTAAAVAARFPVGVETVYVASGVTFPDALAGAALAAREGAPILLARPDRVPTSTLEALERLDPQRIVLLGDEPTLGQAVADDLGRYGAVSRIAGVDRYATAALIASEFDAGVESVYVASGRDFPDALAGAAAAGATGSPLLLSDPETLPSVIAAQLRRLEPSRIVLLGGTPSVSEAVEAQLRDLAPVERIAGVDRFETASLVAAGLGDVDRVYVASGSDFPDALAGAALAGAHGAPVLLALRDQLPPSTEAGITAGTPRQIVVLGDANAISNRIADQMAALVR